MVDHLVAVTRQRGFGRLSLETGTMAAFAPARSLYLRAGFEPCSFFDRYSPGPSRAFMTRTLEGGGSTDPPRR